MRIAILFAFSALSACSATIPPVEVTRFNTGQQMVSGSVAVVPMAGGDSQGLEFRTYASAVSRQLAALGYADNSGSTSPYIAEVDYSRGTRTEAAKRSPFTIGIGGGIGGGSYGRGGGIGIGTSIGLGRGGTRETVITRLSVRIKSRADGKAIWEGRAETAAPARAPSAAPGLAADKLAAALFKGFPGQSGETILVP